jgi:ParB/RepB/Spo0J family partition protein
MKSIPSQPEQQGLKLEVLHTHPLQAIYYPQTSQDDDVRLVKDLREHGQRDALVVVPMQDKPGQYLILDGHRRVSAARSLGWSDIAAIIRHDLADADKDTVEAEFLRYNLNRRQLHPLDKARVVLRQFEIEKRRPRGGLRASDEQEARDRVGKAIGMSGRHLSRLFRLLLTPLEIQNAYKHKKLPLVLGEKVSWLSKEQQAEIAQRIGGGENAKAVVGEYIESTNGRHKHATDAFGCFAKNLEKALADLEDRPDSVYRVTLKEHTPLLKRGQQLLSSLIVEGRKKPGSIAEVIKGSKK